MVKKIILIITAGIITFSCSMNPQSSGSKSKKKSKTNNSTEKPQITLDVSKAVKSPTQELVPTIRDSRSKDSLDGKLKNIALNKYVYASSIYSVGYKPEYAVDGNDATAWGSAKTTSPEYFIVDLEEKTEVRGLIVNFVKNYAPNSFKIYTSDNANNWKEIADIKMNSMNYIELRGYTECRYFGIYCEKDEEVSYGINEIEIQIRPKTLDGWVYCTSEGGFQSNYPSISPYNMLAVEFDSMYYGKLDKIISGNFYWTTDYTSEGMYSKTSGCGYEVFDDYVIFTDTTPGGYTPNAYLKYNFTFDPADPNNAKIDYEWTSPSGLVTSTCGYFRKVDNYTNKGKLLIK